MDNTVAMLGLVVLLLLITKEDTVAHIIITRFTNILIKIKIKC